MPGNGGLAELGTAGSAALESGDLEVLMAGDSEVPGNGGLAELGTAGSAALESGDLEVLMAGDSEVPGNRGLAELGIGSLVVLEGVVLQFSASFGCSSLGRLPLARVLDVEYHSHVSSCSLVAVFRTRSDWSASSSYASSLYTSRRSYFSGLKIPFRHPVELSWPQAFSTPVHACC